VADERTEIEAMEQRERARWLTVAEAQALRTKWDDVKRAVDKMAAKFDEEPEAESQGQVFILCAALVVDGFYRSAVASTEKLTKLMQDRVDAEGDRG
jgi:endonuclease III-like uncharacterized protein